MLFDGSYGLVLEGGVEEGELPAGGGFAGDDAELAAEEVEILGLVADVVEGGEGGAGVEVHVGEEAVLGEVEADAYGRGVAVLDLEVDVTEGGVEGAGVGVGDGGVGRDETGEGRCLTAGAGGGRTVAGEDDHVAHVVLVAGGVLAEDEGGAVDSVADKTDAGPQTRGERVGEGEHGLRG